MPIAARSIHREHVEAFIAAELERTAPSSAATRYRALQRPSGWLDEEGEIDGSPMAKTRPPKIPDKPVPVLPDEDVRRLLADCSGKDFCDRRDLAIIRLFLDTGMRLEGMAGLATAPAIRRHPTWTCGRGWCGSMPKGRRELVLPIRPACWNPPRTPRESPVPNVPLPRSSAPRLSSAAERKRTLPAFHRM